MKIYIDPACDIHYSSFYINGLQKLYGKKALKFNSKYFKYFKHNNHFLALVIKEDNKLYRIIIDFTDEDIIDENAYNWCDVYSKININPKKEKDLSKLITIGPSFGICIYSKQETIRHSFVNFIKAFKRIPDKKKFFSDYKAQLKRPKLEDYFDFVENKKNFIYFVSSLWKKETRTNNFRANFIRVAKKHDKVYFEGGFAPRTKNDIYGFEDLTIQRRESIQDYMLKTKQSMITFNTPAVLDCHGGKLAEFLSFGKAIISTEISRKLPSDLIDGQHLLITDGSEKDIKSKIDFIVQNPEIQQELQEQSRYYFDQFLAPEKVICLIFSRLEIIKNAI